MKLQTAFYPYVGSFTLLHPPGWYGVNLKIMCELFNSLGQESAYLKGGFLVAKSKFKRDEFQFVEYTLNAEQLEAFDAWVAKKSPTVIDSVEGLIAEAYKISITWREERYAYIITVTGTEGSRNAYRALSTWSDDLSEGLIMAAYKVLVLLKDATWESTAPQRMRG
jgi:hypothetical protein